MNALRGGMQVHAVPDAERAVDAAGKRLPWGYEYADADLNRRREPEEKGPFGRATRRRGFSRSKTATPARKEDAVRIENMQNEDAIFNSYKQSQKPQKAPLSLIDPNAATSSQLYTKEPVEVMLYGFGGEQQWAAIDFYEKVSGGTVLEDYERHPPNQRFDLSLSQSRASALKNLPMNSLRKRNTFRGGLHWIKITFDSPEAADLACSRSPHPLHGHLVYAEPFMGTGPPNDAPIPYSNAGAQIDSQSLPRSFSTNTISQDRLTTSPADSSKTVSSATVTGSVPPPRGLPKSQTVSDFSSSKDPFQMSVTSTAVQERPVAKLRPMRIQGAKRAELLPAEQAFLPSPPRYTGLLASLPLLSLFFGAKADQTGSQVPRLDDGSFDWKTASLYWCFFAWLDMMFGTDLCGLKGDD